VYRDVYRRLLQLVTAPVRSSVLNEERTAELIVPREFKADSDDKYDAIYILDGIRAYHYVAYDYLRGEGFIPKRTVLVGLLGLKDTPTRFKDFTPTRTSQDSGGADRYLQFLKTELVPLISEKYHTGSERRSLVGGSLAGLFVIHALLNAPTLFKSYVALDPSLWWDRGVENAEFQRKVGSLKDLHRVLWVNGRERPGNARDGHRSPSSNTASAGTFRSHVEVPALCQRDAPYHRDQGLLGWR
jgi:predicted alpha/beta superfamily hydrolase